MPTRPLRLSQAALETLAIAAYRQPVTRAEIEYVRGVDAGAVLRSLLERKLLRIAGHREVAGRPLRVEFGARPYRDREVMVPWDRYQPVPGWTPTCPLEDGIRMVLEYEGLR